MGTDLEAGLFLLLRTRVVVAMEVKHCRSLQQQQQQHTATHTHTRARAKRK